MRIKQAMGQSTYPGRGIVLGRSADGKEAVMAYFIMGRSVNSRNRVFVEEDGGIRTQAYDPALLTDPSLIIYWPVRALGDTTVVTNGDQTDTVADALRLGGTFASALRTREFEPDAPNYTPRVSGIMRVCDGGMRYALSILKRERVSGQCLRFMYEYEAGIPGTGHFIHTYSGDGNPLPSFTGEPEAVEWTGGADEIARDIWEGLNGDNKVSLFVRTVNIKTGAAETRVINKHGM